jgi:hypothetical protein
MVHWALRDGLESAAGDDEDEERPEWDWLKKNK